MSKGDEYRWIQVFIESLGPEHLEAVADALEKAALAGPDPVLVARAAVAVEYKRQHIELYRHVLELDEDEFDRRLAEIRATRDRRFG